MSIPNDGAMEDMFEDLEQGHRGSSPHSSSDSHSGTIPFRHGRSSAAPTLQQASASNAAPQLQPPRGDMPRAYSDPPDTLFALGNSYSSNAQPQTSNTWFGHSQTQTRQQFSSSAEVGGISEPAGLWAGVNLGRLFSDTLGPNSQAPQQQWLLNAETQGSNSDTLAMLLSDSNMRRRATSSPGQPNASLLAHLTTEQQQLLVNSGLDLAMLMPRTRTPNPVDTQLDTAEAVWQHVAGSGADDQTLLALAAGLGLISMDTNTGSVVLTREMSQRSGPRSAHQLTGLLSPDAGRNRTTSPPSGNSAPLPRLAQQGLAGLLGLSTAGMRLSASSNVQAAKSLGSPGPSKQHTLYKTELCRGWIETGTCRYGSKCQFAHGREELRPVPRHPKYKTEVCRSFTATGVCAYGPRCRFIHGVASAPSNVILDGAGNPIQRTDLLSPSGMEGVHGFDDLAPAVSPNSVGNDTSVAGSRKQLLAALASSQQSGMRQTAAAAAATAAAAAAGASGPSDAASMARMAARLLAAGGRASLDSAMSMASSVAGGRNSGAWQDAAQQRSSMDSRTTGLGPSTNARMSLESCMSQGEALAREMLLASNTTSNERLNNEVAGGYGSPHQQNTLTPDSLLSLSASLAAANAAAVGPSVGAHHPYMPGIPEGCVMNINTLPTDPWAGIPTAASQVQQMQQQLFGFPRSSLESTNTDLMMNSLTLGSGSAGSGWWEVATKQQRTVADPLVNTPTQHMSAYQSNLYSPHVMAPHQQQQQQQQATSASNNNNNSKQQQAAGAPNKQQPGTGPSPRASYPGLLTPEKSESSITRTSDHQMPCA